MERGARRLKFDATRRRSSRSPNRYCERPHRKPAALFDGLVSIHSYARVSSAVVLPLGFLEYRVERGGSMLTGAWQKRSMPLDDFQLMVAQARNESSNPAYKVRNPPIPGILKWRVGWLTRTGRVVRRPISHCKSKIKQCSRSRCGMPAAYQRRCRYVFIGRKPPR